MSNNFDVGCDAYKFIAFSFVAAFRLYKTIRKRVVNYDFFVATEGRWGTGGVGRAAVVPDNS